MTVEDMLGAIHDDPGDDVARLALADLLEETGRSAEAELVRLDVRQRQGLGTLEDQDRQNTLLAQGVKPVVPSVVNSIGMRLVLVPPGTFLMGSPEDEEQRVDDEGPQHEVEISQAFYLGAFQVTQGEYQRVMGKNPSYFCATGDGKGKVKKLHTPNFPVEMVSWGEAVEFCRKLSKMAEEKKNRRTYRLPTESEWEYACRGGHSSSTPYQVFHFGNSLSSTQANFDGNFPYGGAANGPYLERTCAVGSYPANKLGLHDMHGNVYEWCSDWYAEDFYTRSPRRDPEGPPSGSYRVVRGGGWHRRSQYCRSAFRNGYTPANRYYDLGFRVAAVPSSQSRE